MNRSAEPWRIDRKAVLLTLVSAVAATVVYFGAVKPLLGSSPSVLFFGGLVLGVAAILTGTLYIAAMVRLGLKDTNQNQRSLWGRILGPFGAIQLLSGLALFCAVTGLFSFVSFAGVAFVVCLVISTGLRASGAKNARQHTTSAPNGMESHGPK